MLPLNVADGDIFCCRSASTATVLVAVFGGRQNVAVGDILCCRLASTATSLLPFSVDGNVFVVWPCDRQQGKISFV